MIYRLAFLVIICSVMGFSEVREVSSDNFQSEIKSGKVLVDFYGPWCGPCKRLAPVLDQVSEDSSVKIIKVNIDKASDLTQQYSVQGVPTLILFENGKEKGRMVGFRDKSAVKNFIETGKS